MLFKVGNKVFTTQDGPLLVVFTAEDLENMEPKARRYAIFDSCHFEGKAHIEAWMKDTPTGEDPTEFGADL